MLLSVSRQTIRYFFLFSSWWLPLLWRDLSAFCFLLLTSCFLWVEFFCCKIEAFCSQWNKDFLFSLVNREGKCVGAVSHGSGTSACNKDFPLCFSFLPLSSKTGMLFPERLGIMSWSLSLHIPAVGWEMQHLWVDWIYSEEKKQNKSLSALCCYVLMNLKPSIMLLFVCCRCQMGKMKQMLSC